MLSFKELSEKKTKVTLNPKLKDVMEKKCDKCGEESCECDTKKKKKCPECDGKGCKHCGGTGYHDGEGEMDEAKVYDPMEDDTFDHDEAEATRGQSGKNKSITVKKKTKKTTKEEIAYVSQEEVSEESTEEVAETETSILTFRQFNEDRAADAKASLEKVKARQKVLDAHEKKTGKKLDITKTPEHKAHKKNFPGAKRQEKKVKGAKETPAEKHNRQVQTYTDRLKKYGKTKKQAAYDKAMSKQTSRFD
ncbi:hypothetical protein [Synechococcus phage S-RS29]|nr:hypothetical protein [Synechococcus phage S-RS29]